MKTLKAITLFCLAILSQVVFAGEWHHINMSREGVSVKVSYTKQYLPATYGTNGGPATGKLFVDLYTQRATLAEKVEVFQVLANGTLAKRQDQRLNEDTARHFWAEITGDSYASHLFMGETYLLKATVDGRVIEFKFKAI